MNKARQKSQRMNKLSGELILGQTWSFEWLTGEAALNQ